MSNDDFFYSTVWHQVDMRNSSDFKCTALKNNIVLNLDVVNNLYVIHSCSQVKISIRGSGELGSETNVVILAADFVQFEDISTNIGLNLYSDAANTRVGRIQATGHQTSFKFSLSAPNTVDITNQTFTGIDLSFFGPQLITMTDTSILGSTFALRSTETLLLNNTRMENVKWSEINVRNVSVNHNSSLGLTLNKCKAYTYQKRIHLEELYCSDTGITISNYSNVNYRFQKEVWRVEAIIDSTTDIKGTITSPANTTMSGLEPPFEPFQEGKCTSAHTCFDNENELVAAVRLNKVKQIEELIESRGCDPSDLLTSEGSKTNAINSINFLFDEVSRFCLIFQPYPKVSPPKFFFTKILPK